MCVCVCVCVCVLYHMKVPLANLKIERIERGISSKNRNPKCNGSDSLESVYQLHFSL